MRSGQYGLWLAKCCTQMCPQPGRSRLGRVQCPSQKSATVIFRSEIVRKKTLDFETLEQHKIGLILKSTKRIFIRGFRSTRTENSHANFFARLSQNHVSTRNSENHQYGNSSKEKAAKSVNNSGNLRYVFWRWYSGNKNVLIKAQSKMNSRLVGFTFTAY